MGFFESFLGAGIAHVVNEAQKEKERSLRWNDLFAELQSCEIAFNKYLSSIGCSDVYVADVEYVNQGNIAPEKQKIRKLRNQVEEFISLGGDGRLLTNIEFDMNDHLEKLKYLKSVGQQNRYGEFVYDDLYTVQNKIQNEQGNDNALGASIKAARKSFENFTDTLLSTYQFDIEEFMGYNYKMFKRADDILEYDTNNLTAYCRQIEWLYDAIGNRICNPVGNPSEVQLVSSALELLLDPLLNHLTIGGSKKQRYLYFMSTLIEAQCSVWKGKIFDAIAAYDRVLEFWWDELLEDNRLFCVDLIYTIFTLLALLGLSEWIDMYYEKYQDIIGEVMDFYANSSYSDSWSTPPINRYASKTIIFLSLADIDDEYYEDSGYSVLYDKGINEWGEINIPHGYHQLRIDLETECLYAYIPTLGTDEVREIPLVEDFFVKLVQQRDMTDEYLNQKYSY